MTMLRSDLLIYSPMSSSFAIAEALMGTKGGKGVAGCAVLFPLPKDNCDCCYDSDDDHCCDADVQRCVRTGFWTWR